MRNPIQIDSILDELRSVWKENPGMRLGQLMLALVKPSSPCPELFHLPDDQLAHRIQDYKEEMNQEKFKLRYVKRRWEESRGDGREWGASWWYFEIDAANNVIRQIELYDNGPSLGYDSNHQTDSDGGLSNTPLEDVLERFQATTADVFNELWSNCSNRGGG